MFWRQNPQFVVDIGGRHIKAVSARYLGKSRFQVNQHTLIDSPDEELFKGDPKADLEIPQSYQRAFADLVKEAGMASKYCILLLPDFAPHLKILPISQKSSQADRDAAVEQEVKAWVTGDMERSDWVSEVQQHGQIHNDQLMFLAMLRRAHVLQLGSLFQKMGAYPVTMDIALLNAINVFHDYLDAPENKDKNIGVMNFGHSSTSIALYKDGSLTAIHARGITTEGHAELLMGGKAFTKRIMEHFKLPEYDAEAYKREEVFFLPEFVPEQDKITNYQVIKPVFGELVKGLFAITENYMAFFREFKVDEIIMTGGGANFSNIDVVLGGHLNIYIKKGSQIVSMVDPAGNELPEDLKNVITPAVGGCFRAA